MLLIVHIEYDVNPFSSGFCSSLDSTLFPLSGGCQQINIKDPKVRNTDLDR